MIGHHQRGLAELAIIGIIAAVVGLLVVGLMTTVRVQHANNVALKTRATSAEKANKDLDKDCRAKIGERDRQLSDIRAADVRRIEAARKARAAAEKENAKNKAKQDELAAQAAGPPAATFEAQCKAADAALDATIKARGP